MSPDLLEIVGRMARREAAAARLPAPSEEAGDHAPRFRVRRLPCPVCGARDDGRGHDLPFGDDGADGADGPVVAVLACETLTARAVAPIALAALAVPAAPATPTTPATPATPAARSAAPAAGYRSRGLTWLAVAGEDAAGRDVAAALAAVDAAESWTGAPPADRPAGPGPYTVAAASRPHVRGATWPSYRRTLTPRFLGPHEPVPAALERHYREVYASALTLPVG